MTKHDWFWVFVKVTGLALIGYAVFTVTFIVTMFGDMPFGSILTRMLINVGVVGGVGLWLIRDGRLLTEWAKKSDH